jgi:glutathione synthase/RimK-type ligase-like ATP-grasp enzyme
MRIAFATSLDHKDLTPDDRLAADALERRGITIVPAVWNDPKVRWEEFDRVVVRSPWDYHKHAADFYAWFNRLDESGVPVDNPTSVLRWNMDKVYLKWIEERGGSVVPTEWVPKGGTVNVAEVLARRGWTRGVVKPTVSASAANTWIVTAASSEADAKKIAPLLERSGLMIQPYLAEIETEGELSMLFYGGKYSHTIRKLPARGDFRVQTDHGGTVEAATPSPETLAEGQRIAQLRDEPLLYARVDGVVVGDEFLLMEFEVLEPQLFLPFHPQAAERFADAVVEAAASRDRPSRPNLKLP